MKYTTNKLLLICTLPHQLKRHFKHLSDFLGFNQNTNKVVFKRNNPYFVFVNMKISAETAFFCGNDFYLTQFLYWEEWETELLKEWFQKKDDHTEIDDNDHMEEILEQLPPTRLEGVIGRMSGIMGNAPRVANDILIHLLTQEKKEMTEGSDYFAKNYQIVKEKHDYIIDRLRKMPHIDQIYYPEACVNITVQINHPRFDDDMKLAVELMKHGTLIMPASCYGYNPSQTTLRITFFEKERQLQHSMDALEQILLTT